MPKNGFYEKVIERLVSVGLASKASIQGCSESEIIRLENHFGVHLPHSYRQFLKYLGKRAGRLFEGSDCFYEQLWNLRSWAEELLQADAQHFVLPRDSFVFSMHQGYEFLYIPTDAGDDPPVFQYVEDQGPPRLTWKKFTDFVSESIEQHEKSESKGLA